MEGKKEETSEICSVWAYFPFCSCAILAIWFPENRSYARDPVMVETCIVQVWHVVCVRNEKEKKELA